MIDRAQREALIDKLEAGDLVRLNGKLRVVRAITMFSDRPRRGRPRRLQRSGRVRSITFSIMRCSWTRQPFTTRSRCDLYLVDLAIVQKAFGCEHGPLDVLLQQQINSRHQPHAQRLLECCDVIGVVS